MKENDQFILDIKRLGINGEGIGFYKRLAVFVDGAIPGEGHNVCITKALDKMAFAKTIEIKHSSPDRIEITCPHYNECGGCNVSHIKYNRMLEFKRDLVIETLNRYTKLNPRKFEIKSTVRSNEIFNYRNRSIGSIKKVNDKYNICMINPVSNEIVPINSCMLQNPIINELNEQILKLAYDMNISLYIPKFNRGILRYLSIRVNSKNEALVCLICGEKSNKIKELASQIIKLENVKGVYENFNNSKKESVFFGTEMNLLEGEDCILEELNNVKYKLYPNTFFHLNTNQANNLYETVLKSLKLSKKETILFTNAGVSLLPLYLSKMTKEVIGIEYNKDLIAYANENAKHNKIINAKFYQGDSVQLLPKMLEDKEVDIIVLESTKAGIDESIIKTIMNSNVKKVVYISSSMVSMAKDLDKLANSYNINSITPIDMLPQTMNIEAVVVLSLKDINK